MRPLQNFYIRTSVVVILRKEEPVIVMKNVALFNGGHFAYRYALTRLKVV